MRYLAFLVLFAAPALADEGFKVLEPGSVVRGHVYAEDGPAALWSGNGSTYVANRFRVGLEIQWGRDYQWLFAWAPIDEISSGESQLPMGDLTRSGTTLEAGYFFIPDRLWAKYSFLFESVRGHDVWGYRTTHGHGLSAGYRFFDHDKMNITAVLGYEYIQPLSVTLVDNYSGAQLDGTYPQAHVITVGLRFGIDLGGR